MVQKRVLEKKNETLLFSITGESFILFVCSLIWPMVDSYYVTLLFGLSMLHKSIEQSLILKKVQWLAETLFEERVIPYFESCNIESIKNAIQTYQRLGIFQ